MHTPAKRRDKPFIWVTWLTGLLCGSKQCKWAAWHRTHFDFNKTPEKDWTESNIKHTEIRNRLLSDLETRDCEILLERDVVMEQSLVTIKGKIDTVAFKDDRGVVFEVKSGIRRDSDRAQLMIYMWMLKRAYKRFEKTTLDGMLVYGDGKIKVSALEINDDFDRNFKALVRSLIHEEPLRKYPSFKECHWCNVADCDERMTKPEIDEPSDCLSFFDL